MKVEVSLMMCAPSAVVVWFCAEEEEVLSPYWGEAAARAKRVEARNEVNMVVESTAGVW